MAILQSVLLFLHLLGMAIIVGSYFANIKNPKVIPGMLHGSYLQLLTGIIMFGLLEAQHSATMGMRGVLGVKLVLGILVAVFAFLGNKRQKAYTGAADAKPQPSATFAHLSFGAALLAVIAALVLPYA
ncbi:hypothetical protein NQ038_01575 [Brevibacterium sp. 50QC2O2]|mgnify:CR=1 FL=1|jgi:Na+-transporting methylmalonyl-CoA/oxaloacetate decarboxylase gamma subunit|uniref:hypothetical protein n=1 Tax=Brevibacterium TaxID=1696 RepID=UPI00211B8406|nr:MULTISPECIES: hypothetical protein [unclassified Brevibacterium]MCQ9369216.1 hypothetical protein [Brevibacterium sp. 91QC2O2]MCQ9386840.1 hypothetical protein [Brevibacterium sp. 68QC2CO]MCQ9387341.1 hypothetical protein [Brevibacterium sp. 50QC2O2]